MDALLSILIIAALVALRSSSKKKQAHKAAARRNNAYAEASETIRLAQQKMPISREGWSAFLKEENPATQTKEAPISRAECALQPAKKASAPQSDRPRVKAAKAASAKSAPPPTPAPPPPEGSISTQGESAAEHAMHMEKVHIEEEKLRQQAQSLRQIRNLNRQKLREAVVMREVLGKPVSLRPRIYR